MQERNEKITHLPLYFCHFFFHTLLEMWVRHSSRSNEVLRVMDFRLIMDVVKCAFKFVNACKFLSYKQGQNG